jgi:adenine/guanine phosphoribosyltransferase-like PRPP-binding protein
VLVVDDVTTTGGTLARLVDLVLQNGAEVVGVGLIATKGLVPLDLGRKTEILVRLEGMDSFEAQKCPLCEQRIPFTN